MTPAPVADPDTPAVNPVPPSKGGKGGGGGGGGKRAPADPEAGKTVDEIRQLRVDKAEALRAAGRNPFAYTFERTHLAAALQATYADLPNGGEAGDDVRVAVCGRVLTRRVMGKLAFVTLRDGSGTIQLYVDKSRLDAGAAGMKELKGLVDAGDFVGVCGGLRRTDRGELSVVAKSIEARRRRRPACGDARNRTAGGA